MIDYRSNKNELITYRKMLRHHLTPAEATLWSKIKCRKICGMQWRRQFSIGRYILDFYCPKVKLAVELDGKDHFTIEGDKYDVERDNFISEKGIKILRFENCEVWNNMDMIIKVIEDCIKERM